MTVRRWTDLAGAPVHSRETPSAAARGAVPWVLVHGLAVSSAYFTPLLRELDRAGAAAVAPDLPGLGHTPRRAGVAVAGGTRDVTGMAAFVGRWLEARWPRLPAGPFPVLGNSLGAQVAVELAASRPDLVSRLVLVGPTPDPARPGLGGQLAALVVDAPRERPGLVAQVAGEVLRTDPRLLRDRARAGLAHPVVRRLAAVDVPVTVVRGASDPLVTPAWGRALAHVAGEHLVELPGAHAVHHHAPGDVAAAMRPHDHGAWGDPGVRAGWTRR